MVNIDLEKVLQYEYCELLLGNRKNISKYYFSKKDNQGNNNSVACERNAIVIIRFAIEKILGWTPQEAEEKLTPEIVKTFKLKQFINQLRWPPEFNKKIDLFYVVWTCYPFYPHLDNKGITESIYDKILNKERNYFPKEFFIGADGEERLKICIAYFAKKTLSFNSEKAIYEFFSDTNKADAFFNKAKLKKYIYIVFGSPLNAIQQVIEDRKNRLVFFTFMFSFLNDQQNIKEEKERKKKERERRKFVSQTKPGDYISLF